MHRTSINDTVSADSQPEIQNRWLVRVVRSIAVPIVWIRSKTSPPTSVALADGLRLTGFRLSANILSLAGLFTNWIRGTVCVTDRFFEFFVWEDVCNSITGGNRQDPHMHNRQFSASGNQIR